MEGFAVIALLSSLLVAAFAAISPSQLYYAPARPVAVTVEGADQLVWMDPTGRVRHRTDVDEGVVALDEALPGLWRTSRVTYVQPTLDGEPTGSALVLQPLLTPSRATMDTTTMTVEVEGGSDTVMGLRVYTEKLVRLGTDRGDIVFRMRPDQAPNTVFNFLHLVEGGFYDGITFHRVVPDFIIQGGDPLGSSRGGPGYWIDYEQSRLPHDFGVISMGRQLNDADTAGSQFFISLGRERTENLDQLFTSFGEMYEGADVIRAIAELELEAGTERPLQVPVIEDAELIPAPPRKEQSLDELLKDVPEEMRELVKEKIER
jgi:cyclophilin family peptidyl-prolyl cis-trans isomerase